MNVHFSSIRQDWKTPRDFFAGLHGEFKFQHDPCPTEHLVDGLSSDWGSPAFVNPPYSDIAVWVKKAWEESQKGKTVVMLIPSRTDTRWWHEYVMRAAEIRFVKGRLKFDGQKHNAPFPSAVIVFKRQSESEPQGEL